MKLRVLPEVGDVLAAADTWYDENGYPGLGERFIETFHRCIPRLMESGESFRTVYAGFRKVLLRPFPYFVFYRYYEEALVVVLVIGAVRDPSAIRGLLLSREPSPPPAD